MIPGNASGLSTLKENNNPFLCNSVFLCPVIVGSFDEMSQCNHDFFAVVVVVVFTIVVVGVLL